MPATQKCVTDAIGCITGTFPTLATRLPFLLAYRSLTVLEVAVAKTDTNRDKERHFVPQRHLLLDQK